jgi:hypothetical protein
VYGNTTSGIIIRDNSTALIQNNKVSTILFIIKLYYRYSAITIKCLLATMVKIKSEISLMIMISKGKTNSCQLALYSEITNTCRERGYD